MKLPVMELREMVVPPAETTFGDALGYSDAGAVSGRGKINDAASGEERIEQRFLGRIRRSPSSWRFPPPPALATRLLATATALKRLIRLLLAFPR